MIGSITDEPYEVLCPCDESFTFPKDADGCPVDVAAEGTRALLWQDVSGKVIC